MSTMIRAELSNKSKWHISKERYYELKHFCLQYPDFKRIYNSICDDIPSGIIKVKTDDVIHKDERKMAIRQRYLDQMSLIEECSQLTDPVLGAYILKGITQGLSYTYLRMHDNIPCGKDMYYDLYRKFFYILDLKKKSRPF